MVSLGDTAISLHILQPPLTAGRGGGVLGIQNPKCQDLPKFKLGEGEGFWNQIPEQGCSGEFGQKFLEACVLEA